MCFCTCVQEKGEVKRPTDDGRHSQVVSRLALVFQTYGVRPELQIKPEMSRFIENVGCLHFSPVQVSGLSLRNSLTISECWCQKMKTETPEYGGYHLARGKVLLFRVVFCKEAWSHTSLVS